MKKHKVIGILGGMGPEASRYLYDQLISIAVSDFGAQHNNDFPEIVLHSIPVPDFISNIQKRDEAKKMLIERTKLLNRYNLSSISIACNTAHILLPELQKISKNTFISMVEEVVKDVKKQGLNRVGLLSSPMTINLSLYQSALGAYNIECIVPTQVQQNRLEEIIRNVIAMKNDALASEDLLIITNSLKENGATGIILGCTELPLVYPLIDQKNVFNSVSILAKTLLYTYYN